jgi:hypothetical protein
MTKYCAFCSSVRKAVIGGMSSGAIGQFLASPTDLVKVQMQMEGRRILEGKPPRYVAFFQQYAIENYITGQDWQKLSIPVR